MPRIDLSPRIELSLAVDVEADPEIPDQPRTKNRELATEVIPPLLRL